MSVLLLAATAACGRATRTASEPVAPPASFSSSGSVELPDRWWTALGDPGLDAAVDTALSANFDLRIAWERLRAARAVTDRTEALALPLVDASAEGRVSTPEDAGSEGGGSGESYSLDLAASYEVDLWGRIGARIDAERLRAEATRWDYRSAALTLSAEVSRTWAQLAEAGSQVQLAEEQVETNATVLELLENRFGTGQVRAVDILRQRQLVESTREQLTLALEREALLEHRLAVLLGRSPQEGTGARPGALPTLPPVPETGVPLELVRRRPDVRSAFLRLRAADADVAAAVSDQFPRLTIFASTATDAGSVGTLFEDWVRSLGGNLLAPLFFGGELRAEVDRAEAVRQQRLYEYGRATLAAFREVEDALAREARQRQRVGQIETQVELAEQAYAQLRVQYFNGTSDYLDVLTALDEVQALRRSLLTARLTLVEARIALYRALAGSFETARETEAMGGGGDG
ncbi:MAG: efflux transporter outer membrane subunit [Longimicrobiales bacterium]|nr:efflux transporter outer membrane subunit [Longimicrobiales bacterium]